MGLTKAGFSNTDIWKGIILFGLNAATYKMALAKTLFGFARQEQSVVSWDELATSFFEEYEQRLGRSHRPQQGNPHRLTVLERAVMEMKAGAISRREAVSRVAEKGLQDVIPRFQTIGRNGLDVQGHFYEFEYGSRLEIKDTLLDFGEAFDELESEFMARWSLLEGAFEINQNSFELANDIREIYLVDGYERTPITSNVPFLTGYQGNTCFYCGEALGDDVHVDHVLPRQVLMHDEVWNLVLAHGHCNMLKSDKLVGPHFMDKLVARNENIMGSNHPWKHKISAALGVTPKKRESTMRDHYSNVQAVLGRNYWGGSESYNPETDEFYRRLITVLNNKEYALT
jgi:hypothetical protein